MDDLCVSKTYASRSEISHAYLLCRPFNKPKHYSIRPSLEFIYFYLLFACSLHRHKSQIILSIYTDLLASPKEQFTTFREISRTYAWFAGLAEVGRPRSDFFII